MLCCVAVNTGMLDAGHPFHGRGLSLERCSPYKVKKGKERQGTLNTTVFRFSDRGVRLIEILSDRRVYVYAKRNKIVR